MAASPSRLKTWLNIVGVFVLIMAFISFRVYYLRSHGQSVFWLAELFSPVALFCVLLVTFVDKLVRPVGKVNSPRGKKTR